MSKTYQKIYNPQTKQYVDVTSQTGQKVLNNYMNGGSSRSPSPRSRRSSRSPSPKRRRTSLNIQHKTKINTPSNSTSNKIFLKTHTFQCGRFKTQDSCVKSVLNKIHEFENDGRIVHHVLLTSTNIYGKTAELVGNIVTLGMAPGIVGAHTTQCTLIYSINKNGNNPVKMEVKTVHSSFYKFSFTDYMKQVGQELNNLTLNDKKIITVSSDQYKSGVLERTVWYTAIFYR